VIGIGVAGSSGYSPSLSPQRRAFYEKLRLRFPVLPVMEDAALAGVAAARRVGGAKTPDVMIAGVTIELPGSGVGAAPPAPARRGRAPSCSARRMEDAAHTSSSGHLYLGGTRTSLLGCDTDGTDNRHYVNG